MIARHCIGMMLVAGFVGSVSLAQETHQATGVKVGEVTDTSAIVWMRLTAKSGRNNEGIVRKGKPAKLLPADVSVDALEGSCPGMAGQVRLRYGTREDLSDAKTLDWVPVTAATDFTHQFRLIGLKPNTVYHYAAETAGPGGNPVHGALRGRFETAPPADQKADLTFTVITCMGYRDVDHKAGFHIFEAMQKLQPRFCVATGDNVYYDSDDPLANTMAIARYHWHRMYSFPRLVSFFERVPGYWEKDDHDTLSDDCWPTMNPKKMLPMTFPDGQRIFREEVPMGEKTYRTFRWGKGLQIWLTEGRDFRSPNTMKDGSDKTIWGAEQKQWLMKTLQESDAVWKVLISPTPLVGPDRDKKGDNHANKAFQHEGDEFRRWAQQHVAGNFFIACGDRHWQYHSVHPETGLHEFACGAASDEHAGGSPGMNPQYHRFHLVKGGFLSVTVGWNERKGVITFRHHDVHGKVVHEYRRVQGEKP